MKGNKGITLIALIITIILILIIIGVTIRLVLDGGLFSRANKAKNETQIQMEREQLALSVVGAYDLNGRISSRNDLDILLLPGWTLEAGGPPYVAVSPKQNRYEVTERGEITYIDDTQASTNNQ